jgi:hypothetical protein
VEGADILVFAILALMLLVGAALLGLVIGAIAAHWQDDAE